MNSHVEIEQALESLGNKWPPGDSLVDRVMRRVESGSVRVARQNIRLSAIKSLIAVAASLVIAAGLWWTLSGNNTLYAQVTNALQQVHSLHMTATVDAGEEKPAQPAMESWYERGVGFRETVGPVTRVGNQKSFWTYLPESKTAIRSESHGVDDIVSRMLDNEIIKALDHAQVKRDAKADEVVDGQRCKAFVVTNLANAVDPTFKAGKRRLRVLLDDQSRIMRAFMEVRTDDHWAAQLTFNWKYDVPVDPGLFEPHFADDVRIADADAVFNEFVDLKNAIYREQRAGIIYAIHHAERFQDGGILVVSSGARNA